MPENIIQRGRMSSNKPPYRSLKDVSYDELKAAVVKMAEDLGIAGSGSGYSLYEAVFKEKEKVAEAIAREKKEFNGK
jgi:hypothetical protein